MNKEQRFWGHVEIRGADDCWPWLAGRQGKYGRVRFNTRRHLSHRVAYALSAGVIDLSVPAGRQLLVLHKCDNPPCCNPRHLFLGNQQDNSDDKRSKGRGRYPGRRPKLTNGDIAAIKAKTISPGSGYKSNRREVAQEYGISTSCLWAITTGRSHNNAA